MRSRKQIEEDGRNGVCGIAIKEILLDIRELLQNMKEEKLQHRKQDDEYFRGLEEGKRILYKHYFKDFKNPVIVEKEDIEEEK